MSPTNDVPSSIEEDEELGVESFDSVLDQKNQPQVPSDEKGFLRRTAESVESGEFKPISGVLDVMEEVEPGRHLGRIGARIAETTLGLPGDIKELVNSMLIAVPEYISGEELPRWRQAVEGPPRGAFLGGLTEGPTSREIREGITQEATGGDLEPQNKWEEFGDEIAQDFVTLLAPVKGKVPFVKALGSSILANAGAEVAGAFGGDLAKAATKMGVLFAGGLLGSGNGGVKKHIRNLYKEMEATVPEGAQVSATSLEKSINKIEAALKKGDPMDASKQPAFQKIKAIREKIQSGNIDVDEVLELTKSTNESIFGLGDLKRGQNKLYGIRNALHETAKDYGSQNADFLSNWKSANQAFAATETSRRIGTWVRKNIRPRDYIHAAAALGVEGAVAGLPATAGTLGAGAAVAATAYTAEIMKRIAQSPALRQHYSNVVKNSLKQNKTAFLRNINLLNKGLEKEFKEVPFETMEFSEE